MSNRSIALTVVAVVLLMLVIGVVFAWRVAPAPSPLEQARSGLVADVDTLRIAETTWSEFADGAYLPCGSEQAARAAIATDPPTFSSDDCWTKLGFVPPTPIRGGYWITVTADGFEAHAIADADHDGHVAEIVGTNTSHAAPKTPRDVY